MNQTILIPALTLALTVSGCGSKHNQDTADRHPGKNSTAMHLTKTTLPNGLTVIVSEDHSAPVASVQAWCAAGSITEGRYLGAGISHILEHMLFKGTARRGNSEIALTVQNVGGYVNAYTSFDRTVYHINLPAANWRVAADVLADAVFHSTLPVEEYAKEQEVIRREFAMGEDDPDRALSHLLFATAYTVHPYQYPVIGHLAVYNQLTRDDVLAYYRRYYLPNNITFIVSGDVNAGEVIEFLRQATADVPRGAFEPEYIAPEPPQLGARDAAQTFPTDVTRLALAWHIPAITDPDVYALDVLAVITGDGASSRFHRALVEEKKLLREVGVFSFTPAQAGLWCVSATLLPDAPVTAAQAREEILQLIARLQTTAVSAAELEKARRKAVVARAAELKTVSGQAGSIGSGWFAARDVNFAENYLRRLREVTVSDVQRVAQKYLNPDNRTVVTLLPENSVADRQPAAADQQSSALEQLTLGNGARLVLKHDTKIPLVTVRAILHGGLLTETAADNGISSLTIRLLNKGTKTRTAEQLAADLENLGGNFSANTGNNSMSIAIEVLSADVDQAVELLADMLLNATFPAAEVDKEKAKQLADLKLENDEPLTLARNTLRHELFGDHPYGLPALGTADSVEKITRENIAAYYQKLVNPGIVFTISGSFDRDNVQKLLNAKIPTLPAAKSYTGITTVTSGPHHISNTPTFSGTGQTVIVPTNKQQAIVEIGYPGVTVSDSDRPALELINAALSDLASRLFIRIREQQSLAYFVGTNQMLGTQPGYFMFYAGTEAAKGEKVRAELLDEIKNLTDSGFTSEEIERARAKLLGQRLWQDQSADAIAYKAGLNILYHLGLDYEASLNDRLKTLSVAEVNAVAKKYFSANNYVTVIVQPNQNSKAQTPISK